MFKENEVASFFLLAVLSKRAPTEGFTFTEDEINGLVSGKLIVTDNHDAHEITIRLATEEETALLYMGDARWMRTQ